MTKKEVVEKRLENFVVNDIGDEMLTFEAWWRTVEDDEMLEVQYPRERHGLAGSSSNHSKTAAMLDFLDFVDANTQPNGHQASSYSAVFLCTEVHTYSST